MSKFTGKVAVITGSTDGIGFAIAQRFCRDGACVVVSSRKEENVKRAVKELISENPSYQCHGVVCHVGNPEDRIKLIKEAAEKFGKIDFLISNAAVNPVVGKMAKVEESAWNKLFDVNLKASFFLTKEALPHMGKGSSIIFVSSVAAYNQLPHILAYSITKTALNALTKALATELGPMGIRVNCIAPGVINTRFSDVLSKDEKVSKELLDDISLGRFGSPKECSGVVSFLCSEDASYINGEVVVISGGMTSRL